MATLEIVNVGALPNDGEGDPLRVAFQKINNNFANLWSTGFFTSNTYTVGNTAGQIIFETSKSTFTQGIFQIRSSDPGTPDSQDIMIQAQITNNLDGVKFTAYGTSFNGNAVCSYDMSVLGSNVRITVNPLVDAVLEHFISSQITYMGNGVPGLDLALDGYADSVLSTEDDLDITTEGT
jgi:hypothetical protein